MDFEKFQFLIGSVVLYCQMIENDTKIIYAAMEKGEFFSNYDSLLQSKITLGQMISALEQLDNSDSNPFFSKKDYKYLKSITKRRNHWCHETFLTFIYLKDFIHTNEYKKECNSLLTDFKRLSELSKLMEKYRLEIVKKYKRI